jgi:hypothetical protein
VHNKYKDMNALMKKAGRALNLKPHWITPLLPGAPKVLICGPGDIGSRPLTSFCPHRAIAITTNCPMSYSEGHLGTDGRFYVLDTARVFPPTYAQDHPPLQDGVMLMFMLCELNNELISMVMMVEQHADARAERFLLVPPHATRIRQGQRPSPLFGCLLAVSPTSSLLAIPLTLTMISALRVMCSWAHDPDNPQVLKQHNAEIVEATNQLIQTVIPAFAGRLQAFFESIFIENLKYVVVSHHRDG